MTITVLSKPGCQPCIATKRKLDQLGIPHTVRDVTQDPDALDLALATGHRETPVVIVDTADGRASWSGYRPNRIEELAA